jgi:predicted permease
MLFVNVILPVFLMAFAGYLIERKTEVDRHTLTNVSLLLFTPALVFSSLINRKMALELLTQLSLYMVLYTAALTLVAILAARSLHFDGSTTRALILTTAMMNVGNFGLPLAYFAYGDQALDISILTFVLFSVPLGTLAIIVAQGENVNWLDAVKNMLRIPIFHAVVLALLCKGAGWHPPQFILRPIELLGQAAIPVMLILLGMQLARSSVRDAWGFFSLSTGLRLLAAPAIGFMLTLLLGMTGLVRDVVILQTSTPAAVLTLLYAIKFDTRPDLVSGSVFVGTLASAGTLTLLLYWLPG